MKKSNVLLLMLLVAIGISYLIYKSWVVFGWWTLTWTGLISMFSTGLLSEITSARSENNGIVIYNPKEWPKYLSVLISLSIGYYLFTKLNLPGVKSGDYTFGVSYLITLTVIPVIYSAYKITRDRNDYINIDSSSLSYRDNENAGNIKFNDIALAKLSAGIIHITLKNSETVVIKLKNMNFNKKDQESAFAEIAQRISTVDENEIMTRVKSIIQ